MKKLFFKNVNEVIFKNNWLKFKRNNEWNVFRGVENVIEEYVGDSKNITIHFMKHIKFIPPFNVGDFIIHKNNNGDETCRLVTNIKEYEYETFYFNTNKNCKLYGHDMTCKHHNDNPRSKHTEQFRLATEDEINTWKQWMIKCGNRLLYDYINSKVYHTNFDDWFKKDELLIFNEKYLYKYKYAGSIEYYNSNGELIDMPIDIVVEEIYDDKYNGKIFSLGSDCSKIRRATKFEKQLHESGKLKL